MRTIRSLQLREQTSTSFRCDQNQLTLPPRGEEIKKRRKNWCSNSSKDLHSAPNMSPPCGGHDQGPRERVNRVLNCHLEQVRDVSLGYQDYPLESASRTGSINKSTPHTSHRCTGIARIYPGPGPALSRFRTALFIFEGKQNKTTLAPRIPWKDKRPEL